MDGSGARAESGFGSGREPTVDELREHLFELDVSSATLRADPRGQTWLNPEWRAFVERDASAREALADFVEDELVLFDSVRTRPDFVFTTRVLDGAGGLQIAGTGLDPGLRTWIIAAAHAIAFGVAYLCWTGAVMPSLHGATRGLGW